MLKSDEFKAIPYSFALVNIHNKPLISNKNILASCPSFHILLDHTIAVIWVLFSLKDKGPVSLRSGQISWAIRFLEGMANDSRIYCCGVDIKKAIECLQSSFINCISQEHPFNIFGGEMFDSGTKNEGIEENGKLMNLEFPDSNEGMHNLKSIVLKDLLKR